GEGLTMKNIVDLGWEQDLIKGLGVLPCPYHRYYYQTSKMLEEEQKDFAEKGSRAQVVQQLEQDLFELYKNPDLSVKPEQLEERGGADCSDAACSLINSIYDEKRDTPPVSTQNNGAVAGMPDDSAVEVKCVITKYGPRPIAVSDLPVAVRGLVQQIKSF